jgi:hypothetical protein
MPGYRRVSSQKSHSSPRQYTMPNKWKVSSKQMPGRLHSINQIITPNKRKHPHNLLTPLQIPLWKLHAHPLIPHDAMTHPRVIEQFLLLRAFQRREALLVHPAFSVADVLVPFFALHITLVYLYKSNAKIRRENLQ